MVTCFVCKKKLSWFESGSCMQCKILAASKREFERDEERMRSEEL